MARTGQSILTFWNEILIDEESCDQFQLGSLQVGLSSVYLESSFLYQLIELKYCVENEGHV